MESNILIIVNPKAGKCKISKYINDIEENLKDKGFFVETKYTTLENDAIDILKNYDKDFELLIVCGGDGTLNKSIQAICELDKNVAIGYIPFGTTNDFAKSLKVSFDKFDISNNINQYIIKGIDIGGFNDKIFDYVVCTGLFSKTSYKTSTKAKNRFGRLAYIISGIKEIFSYKPIHLKIYAEESQENNIIEDDFIYASISNSEYIGGFHIFRNNQVKLDDGKFEVLLVKKTKNLIQTLSVIKDLIFKGKLNGENIIYFKASKLSIESPQITEWSIDGEYCAKVQNIEILNLNKAIKYMVNRNGNHKKYKGEN